MKKHSSRSSCIPRLEIQYGRCETESPEVRPSVWVRAARTARIVWVALRLALYSDLTGATFDMTVWYEQAWRKVQRMQKGKEQA